MPQKRFSPFFLSLPFLAFWGLLCLLGSLLVVPLASAAVVPASSFVSSSPLLGYWQTEGGDGIVQIYACEDQLCGRFAWLKKDSAEEPSLDDRNPDAALRQRPLCGLQFMGGFRLLTVTRAEEGWIYSPRHGAMFSAEMSLADPDTLILRGYMLFPFLGQDQAWKRVAKPVSWCGLK